MKQQTDEQVIIFEDVQEKNLRRLASAVITRAVEEARNRRDIVKQLDAVCWLAGDDCKIWLSAVEMDEASALAILTSGRLKKLRNVKKKGHRKNGRQQ